MREYNYDSRNGLIDFNVNSFLHLCNYYQINDSRYIFSHNKQNTLSMCWIQCAESVWCLVMFFSFLVNNGSFFVHTRYIKNLIPFIRTISSIHKGSQLTQYYMKIKLSHSMAEVLKWVPLSFNQKNKLFILNTVRFFLPVQKYNVVNTVLSRYAPIYL